MTETQALTTLERTPAGLMAEATAMAKALVDFLPGGATLPEPTRKAMAMLAVQHGLDPFLGEVYAIPQKRENKQTGAWEVVGYALGVGRGGWLRNAERSGLYRGHGFRPLTAEESEGMGIQNGDVGICCFVTKVANVHDGGHRGYEIEGFGVVLATEKSKMNHYQLARKRAFVDALRMAFPMQALPMDGGGQMQVRVVDDETGEFLDSAQPTNGQKPLQIVVREPIAEEKLPPPKSAPKADAPVDATFTEAAAEDKPAKAAPVEPPKHWIDEASKRNYFWARAKQIGHTAESAHEGLGVKTMREYKGSMEEALEVLDKQFEGKE